MASDIEEGMEIDIENACKMLLNVTEETKTYDGFETRYSSCSQHIMEIISLLKSELSNKDNLLQIQRVCITNSIQTLCTNHTPGAGTQRVDISDFTNAIS
ncbi:hypothetical protein ANN_08972 [Periplaneta americana]|uniref:Uncharacterized protein n=1 Tax=Periplaneta americana TaxID=6978 RepID=A0ABQ8T467_PERAM|nr:hypothetical protein ANN_08972 [Periplaneta americana]